METTEAARRILRKLGDITKNSICCGFKKPHLNKLHSKRLRELAALITEKLPLKK